MIYTVRKLTLHTFYMDTPHSTYSCPYFHFYLHQLRSLFLPTYLYGILLYSHRTLITRTVYLAGIWTILYATLIWYETSNRDVTKFLIRVPCSKLKIFIVVQHFMLLSCQCMSILTCTDLYSLKHFRNSSGVNVPQLELASLPFSIAQPGKQPCLILTVTIPGF